jgi:hypothetical protein
MSRIRYALVAVIVMLTAAPVAAQDSGWLSADVGSVGVSGSVSSNPNGRMKVSGEGTDISSTEDGFFFVYQPLPADGDISARVSSLQNTDARAKAGLMLRQSLDAGAINAALVVTPSSGIAFQQRTAANGETTRLVTPGSVPTWLRLVRSGGTVSAFRSSDGANWTLIATHSVPLQGTVLAGMVVTSARPSRLANAWFESVRFKQSAAQAPVPPSGPVAAWAFDEGMGGTARDSYGGHHGSVSGASWTTSGRFGGALAFDGIDDVVTVEDASPLRLSSAMSVSAWVHPDTLSGWRSIAGKEGPSALAYGLYANNDVLRPTAVLNTETADAEVSCVSQLAVGVWSHVAVTYDGQTARLFVNGTEAGTRALAGALVETSGAFRIGGNAIWGEWFHGTIDNLRLYDRALSAEEIQGDMNTAVPSTPLVDATPPSVTITSPTSGATVAGTITLSADATDDVELASVQFRLNGNDLGGVLTSAPFTMTLDTTALANGSYTLTAVATDAAGNQGTSAPVSVTVSNTTAVVVQVKFVEFNSADHAAVRSDGQPVVSDYTLEVWTAGDDPSKATPAATSDLGKPAGTSSFISVDQEVFLASLPKGITFFATVRANGPGGSSRSTASNTFSIQ